MTAQDSALRQRPVATPNQDVVDAKSKAANVPAETKIAQESSPSVARFILGNIIIAALFFFLSSRIITNTWTWNYPISHHFAKLRSYFPGQVDRVFSEKQLAKYDGSDPSLPIYLAINGVVYDVTAGKDYYGPEGGYHFFAGKDASRAYVTGCFETHLTHDLRGLTPDQVKQIDTWQAFYEDHAKYFRVGKVIHPPIDPASPIPEDCNAPKGEKP